MKRIKNMRSFVTAIIVLILGGVCFGIIAFRGMETRLLIAGFFFTCLECNQFLFCLY